MKMLRVFKGLKMNTHKCLEPFKILIAFFVIVFFGLLKSNLAHATPKAIFPHEITWRLINYSVDDKTGDGRSISEFIIKNTDKVPLELGEFSIFFNCMSGANSDPDGNSIIEHVNGTFYKITPKEKKISIPSGGEFRLKMVHQELLQTISKAPIGPFIVFNDNPSLGLKFAIFNRIPLMRAQKHEGAPDWFSTIKSPNDIFEENKAISNIELRVLPPVYPKPAAYIYGEGSLKVAAKPNIDLDKKIKGTLKAKIDIFDFIKGKSKGEKTTLKIRIGEIPGQSSDEAYSLKINQTGIEIIGKSQKGIFHGIQSLRQIILQSKSGNNLSLPYLEIIDAPRFEYRGLLIDVARNFKSIDKLHQTLEIMARLKLNKLHLHFSDDEGWRIEIKSIPELTTIGAKRGFTNAEHKMLSPAYGSGPYVKNIGGSGYYSQKEYIELLKHAAALNIEIIPEVEMPGHARAAVKAMEARYETLKNIDPKAASQYLLSDLDDKSVYRSAQLYSDNVINPALESTYNFADIVIGEFAQMHHLAGVPLKLIHLGADELGNGAWEKSPKVSQLMQKLNTNNTADVWDYYYDRMNKIAAKHGTKIGGWEELGMRKLPKGSNPRIIPNSHFTDKNFLLFIWNNLEGSEDWAYQLANLGYDVVLAPVTNFYFDMMHQRDAAEPGHDWSRAIDLKEVFEFDPYGMVTGLKDAQPLNDSAKNHIKGIEATMFSETMVTNELHDYLLFPRIFGLSERAWSKAPEWQYGGTNKSQDWSRFMNQLSKQFLVQLEEEFPNVNYRMPAPGLSLVDGAVKANYQFPGFEMRYTIDGTIPNLKSPIYSAPIKTKGKIIVAAFAKNGRMGPVSEIENR